ISFKVTAPPVPGTTLEEWTDGIQIKEDSFSQESGYQKNFFNRIIVKYDYDEEGEYETWLVASDTASQGAGEHNDERTKIIESKWFRSRTYSALSNITGGTLYHVSKNNGLGDGTLTFTYDAGGEHTLKWTAPGGTIGEAVSISKDGKYQVFDTDKTKYCRVVIDHSALPGSSQSDTVTISSLNGDGLAAAIANKELSTYRNPRAIVKFKIDMNHAAYNGELLKPSDLKELTTGEASEHGESGWNKEKCLITSVRPNFKKGV
ncbi:unnamed protein product, partial [marine sediment metagenome]